MALTRLLPRPNSRARTDRGPALARVIAFANQKGGVAKTTTTLNLGVALVEKGQRVLAIDLAGAELALSSMIGRERALEKALLPVREAYDYILIDTPPSLGLLTINAFVAADGVIVPVQCEYLSLRGLVQLENTLAMIRENLNPKIRKTVRFAEAPVKGQSVLKYDPTGEAASMYRDLAKEVLNGASARQHA